MSPKNDPVTDDVLDFINSLPDSKNSTPKPSKTGNSNSANSKSNENDEDLLEFLDELANHEKSKPSTPTPSKLKFEPKKKQEQENDSKEQPTEKLQGEEKQEQSEELKDNNKESSIKDANEELDIDPLSSISSWWNKEGSSKVSSLWGSITSNAQQLSEQTYQLASSTTNQLNQQRQKFLNEETARNEQILNVSNKLNSILLSMSQQIKQGLIDDDDELLNILLIYDLHNLNYLDKLCYDKFNKVMNQVEGGIKVTVNNFNHKESLSNDSNADLNMFYGKIIDGEKLCFANLESSIKDYLKITKSRDEANEQGGESKEKEENEELNKINKSNIFISIQPITSRINQDEDDGIKEQEGPILIESNNSSSFSFTFILKDITNDITIITKTQPFPLKWAKWLNGEIEEFKDLEEIDPSEWVKHWIKDGLSLSLGVLAQEYVIKRMGY